MELFKKSPKPNKTDGRRIIELVSNEDGTTQLAFGLHWSSIVSTGGKIAAVKIAKSRGASHMLYRGQQVGFGYIDLKKAQIEASTQIFPASMIVARQFGGDGIYAVKIGQGEYWLAVVRNSQPTSIDQFIFAKNDSTLLQEVSRVLATGEEEGVKYTIYTNLESHDFGVTTRLGTEDLILSVSQDSDFMETLPSIRSSNIPMPMVVALVVALAAGGGMQAWKWKARNDAKRLAALNAPQAEDPPEVAWGRAVAQWEKSNAAANAEGMLLARDSLGRVPVLWYGWTLLDASCNAHDAPKADGSSLDRRWDCSANYERNHAGVLNREMVGYVFPDWTISFQPLNRMKATWSLNEPVAQIKVADLNNIKYHYVETLSKLQAVGASFSKDVSLAFAPVQVPAPRRKDGSPYEPNPAAVGFQSSALDIAAPLRSIDNLAQVGIGADWTSIRISISKEARATDTSPLNKSSISAELKGILYAKNN